MAEYHPLIALVYLSYRVFVRMQISYVLYATRCLNKIFCLRWLDAIIGHRRRTARPVIVLPIRQQQVR